MHDQKLFDRLRSKVSVNEAGCWLWASHIHAGGYGVIRVGREVLAAHRAMWLAVHGTLPKGPKGPYVCHSCDVRACCNPAHLWLGSATDNSKDRDAKGRNGYSSRTHCKRGHEFTPENTVPNGRGRGCRTCANMHSRLHSERQRRAEGAAIRAPLITEEQRAKVLELRRSGLGYKRISKQLGLTVAMVFRAIKKANL